MLHNRNLMIYQVKLSCIVICIYCHEHARKCGIYYMTHLSPSQTICLGAFAPSELSQESRILLCKKNTLSVIADTVL